MWPFYKKNIYKITWSYGDGYNYTEIIAAKNASEAWQKHRKTRALPTYCVKLEVIDENGNAKIL